MATRTTITLEDDLDGGPADQTLHFHFGAAEYEIDLNAKNAAAFRRQLAPFVNHARQAARAPLHRQVRTGSARQDSAAIREWAKAQGIQISQRGRIPAGVIEQYQAADGRH
jgi:hypothetical protein